MGWICSSVGRISAGALWCAALGLLILIIGAPGGPVHVPPDDRTAAARGDTVAVEGRVVSVGNELFTRLRLIEKGGGGYILNFDDTDPIKLRRQGPTDVRVVGIPFMDMWQGREETYLRVIAWTYVSR